MTFAKLSGALLARKDVQLPRMAGEIVPSGALTLAHDPLFKQTHVRLERSLKSLRLSAFLREYEQSARQCAAEGLGYSDFLLQLAELELAERRRRMVERRIKAAHFPLVKALESFDFTRVASVDKENILQLARGQYISRRENVLIVGNGRTGKTHIAIGLGLAACQQGSSVAFTVAASLAHQLVEAQDRRRLIALQRRLASYDVLIIDELGYAPLSITGARLIFEVISQRYERRSTIITSNCPLDVWVSVFGSEQLTNAVVERLIHYGHILEMLG